MPGPGDYNQGTTTVSSKFTRTASANIGGGFGRQRTGRELAWEKRASVKGTVPGPGEYQLAEAKPTRGAVMSKAKKYFKLTNNEAVPGPGSY